MKTTWIILDGDGALYATVRCETHPENHGYAGLDWAAFSAVDLGDVAIDPAVQSFAAGTWADDPAKVAARLRAKIDAERDRRIGAGMSFGGVRFQTREQDRENVHGAATLALAAMMSGAQPGDLYWHGGAQPFAWIAEDNSLHPFDAPGFFAFGKAMAAHKSGLIFAARALKDMDPIPADFTADSYWPD
jgi:hypothetical protein